MRQQPLRLRLSEHHPVIGSSFRLLKSDEVILPTDQTARVSLLLSVSCPEDWDRVYPDVVGMTVEDSLKGDMDADERVYRRPIG